MSEVQVLIEREDGALFVIDDTRWRIPNDGLSGWHSTVTSISSHDSVNQDGSTITEQRVQSADRTITVEARDSSASDFLRTSAERFFVPRKRYSVLMTYMGRTRRFDGYQAMFTLSEGNIHNPISFSWTMTCESPYSTDASKKFGRRAVGAYDYGSNMPFMSLSKKTTIEDEYGYKTYLNEGFVTGSYKKIPNVASSASDPNLMVSNDGDVPTKPTFYMRLASNVQWSGNKLEVEIKKLERGLDGALDDSGIGLKLTNVDVAKTSQEEWVVIDLNKRPFAVEVLAVDGNGNVKSRRSVRFTVKNDSMLKKPYLEQGDTYFVVFSNGLYAPSFGDSVPATDKVTMTIDQLYTGV